MLFLGYLAAILVGLTLGIFGAGGSILTIPILIYLFKIDAIHATTYAFFIVGSTALIGSIQHSLKGNIKLKPALYFAIPSVITIFCIRKYIIAQIPEHIATIGNLDINKENAILLFFTIILLASSISMIQSGKRKTELISSNIKEKSIDSFKLSLLGFLVGVVLGFAGVGGGFLITPALVLFARLSIKSAIGTSLFIITLNSFVGFFSSLSATPYIDWHFLIVFIFLTGLGLAFGTYLSNFVKSEKLKILFGWFVLLMGTCILINELLLSV